jgi:hypothetical protein
MTNCSKCDVLCDTEETGCLDCGLDFCNICYFYHLRDQGYIPKDSKCLEFLKAQGIDLNT